MGVILAEAPPRASRSAATGIASSSQPETTGGLTWWGEAGAVPTRQPAPPLAGLGSAELRASSPLLAQPPPKPHGAAPNSSLPTAAKAIGVACSGSVSVAWPDPSKESGTPPQNEKDSND